MKIIGGGGGEANKMNYVQAKRYIPNDCLFSYLKIYHNHYYENIYYKKEKCIKIRKILISIVHNNQFFFHLPE